MTAATFLAAGAFLAGLGVAAGAFGSHWLGQRLSPQRLNQYEIGVRYQIVHALALILCGLAMRLWNQPGGWFLIAGWLFIAGSVLFSGSLYLLAWSNNKRWGMVTPFGGVAWLAGWGCFLVAALNP